MTFPVPADIPPTTSKPRKRTPGVEFGRKPKDPASKSCCLTLTLSSPAARERIKARAKAAGMTPGALVEWLTDEDAR